MALSHQGELAVRGKEAPRTAHTRRSAEEAVYRDQVLDMFACSAAPLMTVSASNRATGRALSALPLDGAEVRASVRGDAEGRSSVPTGAPRYTDAFYDSLEQLALSGMKLVLESHSPAVRPSGRIDGQAPFQLDKRRG